MVSCSSSIVKKPGDFKGDHSQYVCCLSNKSVLSKQDDCDVYREQLPSFTGY